MALKWERDETPGAWQWKSCRMGSSWGLAVEELQEGNGSPLALACREWADGLPAAGLLGGLAKPCCSVGEVQSDDWGVLDSTDRGGKQALIYLSPEVVVNVA